jgi:S-DNA-T family DNA segregation ATPase FtsK/SpoIIIE
LGAGQTLRTFQAARIARPVPDDEHPVQVTPLGRSTRRVDQRGGRTELDAVVEHMVSVARRLGIPDATPLWLPPLPTELSAQAVETPDRARDRLVAVVGLADLPRQQVQRPFTVDLSAAGHLLVSGLFGSGKTTTLTQIGCDLASFYDPGVVHLYGIDAGAGSLAPLGALTSVGDVVGVGDAERLTRLVERLTATIDRRRDALATAGSGNFLRWRAAGGGEPWVVLLVDDYPSFREVAEQEDNGRLLERFNSLLQNGPAVGVHLVVAVTQAVDLRAREINLIPQRIVLRSADVADYALVDGRFAPAEAPVLPPGRGLAEDATEVQVCLPEPDRVASQQRSSQASTRGPTPIRRLPRSVDRAELDGATGLVLGLGGPEVEPVEISVPGSAVALLVAGPRQSGRSSTLLGLVEALRSPHTVVVAPRPSPLRDLQDIAGLVVHTQAEALDETLDAFVNQAVQGSLLVIDDAEAISNAPGGSQRLEQILRDSSETGVHVIVGARVNDLPGMFDPWARYLMSLRRVVLLQPTVDDAFLFGSKLPRIPPPMVPGRGVLIESDRITVVQVAPGRTDGAASA